MATQTTHTARVELRDRFLGPIAREAGEGIDGPAIVDFGDLVRKLVLFDEIIVESHNLKEFGPIAQKFGYEGTKARRRFLRRRASKCSETGLSSSTSAKRRRLGGQSCRSDLTRLVRLARRLRASTCRVSFAESMMRRD
jgi:hypothetical protein